MGSYISIESVISLKTFNKAATKAITFGATDGKSGGWARGDEHKLHIQNTSKYPIKVEIAYRSGTTGPKAKKSVIIPPHQKGICKFYYTIGEVTVTYQENSTGQLPEKKERTKDFEVTMSEAEQAAIIAGVAVALAIATIAVTVVTLGTGTGAMVAADAAAMAAVAGTAAGLEAATIAALATAAATAAVASAALTTVVAGSIIGVALIAGTTVALSESDALQGEHKDITKGNLLIANDYAILNGMQV